MSILQAIIMGIIQGLTEFLPVSSSGHLVITTKLYEYFTQTTLPKGSSEDIFMDIMVHVATLAAVLIYFRSDLITIFNPKNFLEHFNIYKVSSLNNLKNDLTSNFNNLSEGCKMLTFLGFGTIATVLVAFPIKHFAEALTDNAFIVSIMIFITGIILFISHIISTKYPVTTDQLDLKKSIIIGLAQGVAILPGISRSGSTIATGLLTGLDRVKSARFSFVLSIPIILLAAGYEGLKFFKEGQFDDFNWVAIISGSLTSGIVGYFCIKYFIKFLSKYNLLCFAYYCWIVGITMAIFFYFNG